MLTSDERYAQQAESMRQALAIAWRNGYEQGQADAEYEPLDGPSDNPYVKEN